MDNNLCFSELDTENSYVISSEQAAAEWFQSGSLKCMWIRCSMKVPGERNDFSGVTHAAINFIFTGQPFFQPNTINIK